MQNLNSIRMSRARRAFTLIELLIVVFVIGILAAAMGATVNTMFESARETRTTATLQKIDGLIADRQKALERAFASPTFRQFVKRQHWRRQRQVIRLELEGNVVATLNRVPGISEKAVAILARKDWQRYYLPQTFSEYIIAAQFMGLNEDKDSNGIPDRFPTTVDLSLHDPRTESSEMLYFALTRLEVFGMPPVGEDAFSADEAIDTDGDGLLELVDGWEQPLRFYRWPTRLLKPYGATGIDQQPGQAGVDDDGFVYPSGGAQTDDILELSTPGTDDLDVSADQRLIAGVYFSGLPRKPVLIGQYDSLNEEPEDPYGLVLSEVKRLGVSGINATDVLHEALYHTIDTYHKPLVVSVGPDGILGLSEPFINEDVNFNSVLDPGEDAFEDTVIRNFELDAGEDANNDGILNLGNGNGRLDYGSLGQVPVDSAGTFSNLDASFDDITNRNRRAGG